jgi:HAD superfamily hydrolase (TIGR01490 family)
MSSAEKIGAFFDLDGTLLPATSLEWRFIGYLLQRDVIATACAGLWMLQFAKIFLRDPHRATHANKRYLEGVSVSLATEWENSLAPALSPADSLPLFDAALQRITWHSAQKHHIFLVSGTLAPLARMMARRLGAYVPAHIEVRATELEVSPCLSVETDKASSDSAAMWTGRIAGQHMCGKEKSRALKSLAAQHDLDLALSYAYGDSLADVPMLDCVGNPFAVNPSRSVTRIARQRGWQICAWKESLATPREVSRSQLESKAAR